MFARLGVFIGVAWMLVIAFALSDNGTFTVENFGEIGLLPAFVVMVLGRGISWILGGLFR